MIGLQGSGDGIAWDGPSCGGADVIERRMLFSYQGNKKSH